MNVHISGVLGPIGCELLPLFGLPNWHFLRIIPGNYRLHDNNQKLTRLALWKGECMDGDFQSREWFAFGRQAFPPGGGGHLTTLSIPGLFTHSLHSCRAYLTRRAGARVRCTGLTSRWTIPNQGLSTGGNLCTRQTGVYKARRLTRPTDSGQGLSTDGILSAIRIGRCSSRSLGRERWGEGF